MHGLYRRQERGVSVQRIHKTYALHAHTPLPPGSFILRMLDLDVQLLAAQHVG